ncbi:MAG TPA: hypothetical protein VNW52_05660 [Burkholderiaceae bacterium]|jgi:hypothetical protein|nr:hypothetical protein [Burkholderiaceae bacterium]
MIETLRKQSVETPSCPKCGKTVFNKRYPNCEFCGTVLPEGLVLSAEERERVFEQDRVESDAKWQERQKQEKTSSSKRKSDDTYVYVDVGSNNGDCGGHGGNGGGHC